MEHSELDILIHNIKNDKKKRNKIINDYQPYIIKIVSEIKNAYVSLENDEEFSIALMAFDEAIDRYDYDQGHFLNYAKLVMESRIKNYWQKEAKHLHTSIDQVDISSEENFDLKLEIEAYEKELQYFGLDFELLIDYQPKHKDTRQRAIKIGQMTGLDQNIMTLIYDKRRLPVTLVAKSFGYSLKIIKTSKFFILATSIVFYKKFENIINWLK